MKFDVVLVGDREVSRELEVLAKRAGVTGRKFADEAASVGMRALVRTTQPFGLGAKARKLGEGAVARDIGHAFQVVPDGARGSDVIRNEAAARTHHLSVRDARGRVSRSARKRRIERTVFFTYRKKVQGRVGTAKGSWTAGAAAMGARNFQKWITRSKGEGAARRRGRFGNVVWLMESHPEHILLDRVLGRSGAAKVLRSNERNLKRSFQARIKRQMKQAERKLNR